ncbi:MAG: tRNA (N(6)-L-threonylcarbamoyladenosine(37)-C(2))-methylthiotransferase MtaB [Chitinophagaceae bacterium]
MQQKQSVAFHTLGCKLNFSETSTLSRMVAAEGFENKPFETEADIYVINTCSVTENADKECRQIIRRIQKRAPAGMVVITGCYAQLKAKEIAEIPGVDLVLGAAEKFNLPHHLSLLGKADDTKISSCEISEVHEFHTSFSVDDRTRSFLKVQDGCDYNCSFCTIPLARGKSRSDTIPSVIKTAEMLAGKGVKEVVLTGINLGDFGNNQTNERQENLIDLLRALDELSGIERFRISSIEPNLLTENIIQFISESKKFMPHFHIPLQSGSDTILGLMRRRYRKNLYAEKISRIKSLMPHCAIGVDVIVGFPGETDQHFMETVDFIHSLDISYLHVFTYSERTNTKALEITPVVPVHERNRRNKLLRNLSYEKMAVFSNQFSGTTRPVLFESLQKNGMMQGYSDNYIRVSAPYNEDCENRVISWKL